ncbi:MAG: hypothetical protein JNJ80_24475 [Gemmatimonadetes bacterium]|nr:hypothetical protein [Gemmatimonadota bacterium]
MTIFGRQVHGGIYDLKAGERGPEYAEGAFEARFHYYKPTGLYISTFQQSGHLDFKERLVAAEATLYLRTEPGLLDAFVGSLASLRIGKGAAATLTCIPLYG